MKRINNIMINTVCLNTVATNKLGQFGSSGFVPPSPVDIDDAILLSGGQGAILLSDGSYLKMASQTVMRSAAKQTNKTV